MDEQLQYIKQYKLQYIFEYLGYQYDKKKSTEKSKKYKDNKGNIFIIKDNVYFNTIDNTDNGTSIDFIQNHIIREKNFYKVKKWFNENIQKLNNITDYNKQYNNDYKKKIYKTEERNKNSFSILYQKIWKNEIKKIKSIRKININIFNKLIQQNIIKYYVKYNLIKLPLYNENNNIIGILNINIQNNNKWLEKGSIKGIFNFGNTTNPSFILLFESFYDSLSYLQLLNIKYSVDYDTIINNCLFITTNGSISINNLNTIKTIFNNTKNYKVILSFDNDKIGNKYDNDIIQIIPKGIKYYINKSINKDFNDDLQEYYKQQYNKQYINNILNIFNI
jgi:hypothetical protein